MKFSTLRYLGSLVLIGLLLLGGLVPVDELCAQQPGIDGIPHAWVPIDTQVRGKIRIIKIKNRWQLLDETVGDTTFVVNSVAARSGWTTFLLSRGKAHDSLLLFPIDAAQGCYAMQRSYHVHGVPELWMDAARPKAAFGADHALLGLYLDMGPARIRQRAAWRALIIAGTGEAERVQVTILGKVIRDDPSCFFQGLGRVVGDSIVVPMAAQGSDDHLVLTRKSTAKGHFLEVSAAGPHSLAGNWFCMGGGSVVGSYGLAQYVTERIPSGAVPLAPDFERFVKSFPLLTPPFSIPDSAVSKAGNYPPISVRDARRWICDVPGSDWHCVQSTGDPEMDYNVEGCYFVWGRLPMAYNEQVLLYGQDYAHCRELYWASYSAAGELLYRVAIAGNDCESVAVNAWVETQEHFSVGTTRFAYRHVGELEHVNGLVMCEYWRRTGRAWEKDAREILGQNARQYLIQEGIMEGGN